MVISKKLIMIPIIIPTMMTLGVLQGMAQFKNPQSLLAYIYALSLKNDTPICINQLREDFKKTPYDAVCDITDQHKQTALHLACQQGFYPCVEIIIGCCPPEALNDEIFAQTKDGQTPLHYSAHYSRPNITKKILTTAHVLHKKKALLLMQDLNGQTALHTAAFYDSVIILQELVTHAFQLKMLQELLSITDKNQKKAIDIATAKNHGYIVQILEAAALHAHKFTKKSIIKKPAKSIKNRLRKPLPGVTLPPLHR